MKSRPPAEAGFEGGRAKAPSQSAMRERQLLMLIVATAAVLSFAGLSLRASSRLSSRPSVAGASLHDALRDAVAHTTADAQHDQRTIRDASEGGYTAVIIAQPDDCDGNLGVFGLLDRQSIDARIPHRLLLLQGVPNDTVGLRLRLPESLKDAHIALLTKAQRSLLRQLGHVATPSLLLFNRALQLRYAGMSAPGPVERTVQLSVITRLVTNHPDPTKP